MARAGNKSVRFTKVVEESGEPHVHTLWLPPDKDPELQRAQKAHRVLTIESGTNGGKTDVGTVGFKPSAGNRAQFLVFPKSLKRFEGARIIGIKFDLVAQPKLAAVEVLKHTRTTHPRGAAKRSPPPAPAAPKSPVTGESAESASPTDDSPPARDVDKVAAKAGPGARREEATVAPPQKPPAPVRASASKAKKGRATEVDTPPSTAGQAALVREIRAAMKDLERGKSVAAYQRLERAVSNVRSKP